MSLSFLYIFVYFALVRHYYVVYNPNLVFLFLFYLLPLEKEKEIEMVLSEFFCRCVSFPIPSWEKERGFGTILRIFTQDLSRSTLFGMFLCWLIPCCNEKQKVLWSKADYVFFNFFYFLISVYSDSQSRDVILNALNLNCCFCVIDSKVIM